MNETQKCFNPLKPYTFKKNCQKIHFLGGNWDVFQVFKEGFDHDDKIEVSGTHITNMIQMVCICFEWQLMLNILFWPPSVNDISTYLKPDTPFVSSCGGGQSPNCCWWLNVPFHMLSLVLSFVSRPTSLSRQSLIVVAVVVLVICASSSP